MGDVFQFRSSASLEKLTGRQADTLEALLEMITSCPDSSIFFHTFSAFMKLREVDVPYNSDFAIWASRSLNEMALAEKFMAIDFAEYNTVKSLRSRLVEIIESYREQKPEAFRKTANEPFYLHDIVRVVYLTDKFAYDLKSFAELLPSVSIYSLYYHFIESRLQSNLQNDDFSVWIEHSLGMPQLAERIRNIDINVFTLEGLRTRLLDLVGEYL